MDLHLFRSFLKVDLVNSKTSPREVRTLCANNIASLLSRYRDVYCLPLVSHIILTSAIIDFLNFPDAAAVHNIVLNIKSLREIPINHAFATRSLHILMALVG